MMTQKKIYGFAFLFIKHRDRTQYNEWLKNLERKSLVKNHIFYIVKKTKSVDRNNIVWYKDFDSFDDGLKESKKKWKGLLLKRLFIWKKS